MTQVATIPKLEDIYSELETVKKQNDLNIILNAEPKKEWIKHHPIVKVKRDGKYVPHEYIPIERIEFLLTAIFIQWRVEVLDTKLIANSVCVTVRLHVKSPLDGEWTYQDGVGACSIQTNEGAGAIDFNQMKSAAIQMGLPAAKSYAISDAADHFGKIFGKDLNRQGAVNYGNLAARWKKNEHSTYDEDCQKEIEKFTDAEDLFAWAADQSSLHGNAPFEQHVQRKAKQLNNGN